MTLEECYTSCGGDYQDVLRRLQSENLIRRFLGKFWMIKVMSSCMKI